MEDREQIEKKFKQLIEHARNHYTCNRGPRPSSVLIVEPSNLHVWGDVKPPLIGVPSCIHDGCMMENGHCVRNIHAEVDAIIDAAQGGIKTYGAVMYSINKPCYNCTQAIIKAGIVTCYYAYIVYDDERTKALERVAAAWHTKFIHFPLPATGDDDTQ